MSAHRFEDLICTNKLDIFFLEKFFFQVLGAFFTTKKTFGHHFFQQKINFILFSKGDYLILIVHALEIYLEKL